MRNILPFTRKLPDFTRLLWVSPEAREVWEPRVQLITYAWQQVERMSVRDGIRSSALMQVTPEELPAASAWAAVNGLVALPVTRLAVQSYSATSEPAQVGKPWSYRMILTTPDLAKDWIEAWRDNDDEAIGSMLGYPLCCRAAFDQWWVKERLIDTTWPMAAASVDVPENVTAIVIAAPHENNILLRWLGVRAVPHLPCSFHCEPTQAFANDLLVFAENDLELVEHVEWMREMLSWPCEWSGLHGIAKIKTPVVQIIARTDATAEKYTVRYQGTGYPAEGASGNVFPYREHTGPKLTETPSFQKLVQLHSHTDWKDNGFVSREAMDEAHAPILALLADTIDTTATVIDLGAGNGLLLEKTGRPGVGVEVDSVKVQRAHPRVVWGDLRDVATLPTEVFGVALISARRFEELTDEEHMRLHNWLRVHAKSVLVYSYDEPRFARVVTGKMKREMYA